MARVRGVTRGALPADHKPTDYNSTPGLCATVCTHRLDSGGRFGRLI